MFANYKDNIYRFVKNPRTKKYEVVTNLHEKFYPEFSEYKTGAYAEVTLDTPELTSIYDVQLWLNHDTGIAGLPLVWDVSLDGFTVVKDGKISIDYHGPIEDTTNWKRIDKGIWQTFIDLSDVNGAYIVYTYKKKDGVFYEESLVVREDISVEKMLELRNYYGGKL